MKFKATVWLALVVLAGLLIPRAAAQEPPAPGSINLLPGYHHHVGQGIDSKIGIIWKKGDLLIHYDIGELAGNYTACGHLCGWADGELWRREQLLQGQRVICVFTNKRRLIVSFPEAHANFYGTVHTDKELTDMILMLFTFQSPHATAQAKSTD